jgi:large subunit ribosomal protein L2
MPIGTIIHNVEMKPGAGGQLARSAGCYAQLMGKDGVYAQIKMNSGELRKIHSDCLATVGSVSNPDQRNINLGKAGRSRWLGIRPSTRGVAMNPVDHPMGGGNGKSKGHTPVSRTGVPSKGYRTRNNKRTAKMIIRSRHLAKKK